MKTIELEDLKFDTKEAAIVKLVNQGKTFVEIGEELKDSRQTIEYTFRHAIKKKLLTVNKIKKMQTRLIVDLKKEFKGNEFLVGKALGSNRGKTFVPSKMIVVDTKFKTVDNTNFKPLLIQKVMKHDDNGVELPTSIKDIADRMDVSTAELKQIIAHLFKNKIYIHNDYIITTKQVLSVLIPNFVNVGSEKSIEQLFNDMQKNKAVASLLIAKKHSTLEDLFSFISLHYKSFPSNPFLRYKNGWENRAYFYKQIVPGDVDIDEVSKHCIKVAKRYSKKYFINGFSIKALMAGLKVKLDSDIAIAIILDSGLFSAVKWGSGKNVLITDSKFTFTKNIDIIKRIINETRCEISDVDLIIKTAVKYGREFTENIVRSTISANRDIFVK